MVRVVFIILRRYSTVPWYHGTGTMVPGYHGMVPGSIEFERVLRVKLMKTNFVYFVYIIILLKQNG